MVQNACWLVTFSYKSLYFSDINKKSKFSLNKVDLKKDYKVQGCKFEECMKKALDNIRKDKQLKNGTAGAKKKNSR